MKASRKLRRLVVRPVNKRTGSFPDDTINRHLLLIKERNGKIVERVIYFNHSTGINCASGYTHYIILPDYIL